jgi:transposase
MRILAMDLGHEKSVCCFRDAETGEPAYRTVRTRPQNLHDWLSAMGPEWLVVEVSPLAGWICDLARSLGIRPQVANPNHEGWRWKHVKRKTDRGDALKLLQLSEMDQLPLVYMPERNVRQWRSLIGYRQTLVARRTSIRNAIRALFKEQGLSLPSGKRAWQKENIQRLHEEASREDGELWRVQLFSELEQMETVQQQLERIERELDELGKQDDRVQLLQTVPGVGARLSETVAAVLDDPHRFQTVKQVGSYVGLTPRTYQSGNRDRQGKISGEGPRVLRSMLVEAAWLGLRHNPYLRRIYEQVKAGSEARRKIAIVAVARRLLIWCWAILRDRRRWQPPQALAQAATG